MGQNNGCKKKLRSNKASSGKGRVAKARSEIRRIKMKIKRFNRYVSEGKSAKRFGTEGLIKELRRQETLLKRGPKFHVPVSRATKIKAQVQEQIDKKRR